MGATRVRLDLTERRTSQFARAHARGVAEIEKEAQTDPVQIERERKERLTCRYIIMLKGLPSKQQAKLYP
jgi:hypothetical protein